MDWKNDKRIHFAIGLAVTLLAIKMLFFPDNLFYAVEAFGTPDLNSEGVPEAGQEHVGIGFEGILPLIVDFFVTAMVFIGGWIIATTVNIWSAVSGKLSTPTVSPASFAPVRSNPSNTSLETIKTSLAQAAALNNEKELLKIAKMIRRPYAIAQLNEALEKGDSEGAKRLFEELNVSLKESAR